MLFSLLLLFFFLLSGGDSKSKLSSGRTATHDPRKRTVKNIPCLNLRDSTSVSIRDPLSLRSKTKEVYHGFSYVFPDTSTQEDVFVKVMEPLVLDFLAGKSALIAAMGPTTSGKTHTVFGTARDPGIVPLALGHIFQKKREDRHMSTSLYYVSVFEIRYDRGKGERMYDLSSEGHELSFEHSCVRGLRETKILDAVEAESFVARTLLYRATAATKASCQSSRSHCIVNIRYAVNDPEKDVLICISVLTIVDLAGSERMIKTGTEGARLLEIAFKNKSSMVLGQCLRCLVKHQKNPNKPLEKHFRSSLLTRYLSEYLEGKRRMTLILTVKPGENDYLDTSSMLRQAFTCMEIRFNSVEEAAGGVEQDPKQSKVSGCEDKKGSVAGGKFDRERPVELATAKLLDEQKQYKEKLGEKENEVQSPLKGKEASNVNERQTVMELTARLTVSGLESRTSSQIIHYKKDEEGLLGGKDSSPKEVRSLLKEKEASNVNERQTGVELTACLTVSGLELRTSSKIIHNKKEEEGLLGGKDSSPKEKEMRVLAAEHTQLIIDPDEPVIEDKNGEQIGNY